MQRILYLDLIGGLAGDMLIGGLLDLGVPLKTIQLGLETLSIPGLSIHASKSSRHQITGTQFHVKTSSEQPHRSWKTIQQLLQNSVLESNVRQQALQIFKNLADVESHIHDVPVDDIHFHEIGAWDSIADIVAIAICLDYLKIDVTYVSSVPLGNGTIKTAHGVMPIPAPATLGLLRGFNVFQGTGQFERVTPTGASVLATIAKPLPSSLSFEVIDTGFGVGTKITDEFPNLVRCVLGRFDSTSNLTEMVECTETNVDDCSPEWLGYTQERLFEVGALDVGLVPIQMKKNRPGTLIKVLHRASIRENIYQVLFTETTSLGVRTSSWQRQEWARQIHNVETPWGPIQGKITKIQEQTFFAPEYEDCRKIAQSQNLPLRHVYQIAMNCFHKHNQ